MTVRKPSPAALLFLALATACGTDDGGAAADDAGFDIRFSDSGPTQAADTRPADVEDEPDTTAIATDTAPLDTTLPDTAETVVSDTADVTMTTDTFVADTFVADTFVADTFVADTFVADTAVAEDTSVADTIEEDTTSEDTAGPACQIGGCETDVTTAGNNCTNAYVIGRPNAQTGFGHQGSTVGAGNDSDFTQAACGDSGPDRFYRIYLKVGEQLWANINPDPAAFDVTFGLYRGAGCETPVTCVDNDVSGTTPDSMPYQAVEEGWHVLVVDGRGTQGSYSLVVTLDCHEDDCCCE